ncbi:MAG: sialidase family protein [Promethearchaeota archaeon]
MHPLQWAGRMAGRLFPRRNDSWVNTALDLRAWPVVADGWHNSNTDLVEFGGLYYLAHAASPYHVGSKLCRIVVREADHPRSRAWKPVAAISVPGEDVRDPKFAVVGGRLFLYVLKNRGIVADPYATALTTSVDGRRWTPLRDVEPAGWLFWRPKSPDGKDWFAPAYWHEHGVSALFRSTDGVNWRRVSTICSGGGVDETAVEFLPGGDLLATVRHEGYLGPFGHATGCTVLAVATRASGYRSWTRARDDTTRLDGPVLFSHAGRTYAIGRFQPKVGRVVNMPGSFLSRKRTSLFLVAGRSRSRLKLLRLTDLPSAGDTSYAGVVARDGYLYACYYTSPLERDYCWFVGMFNPSHVFLASLSLESLERVAAGAEARVAAEAGAATEAGAEAG